MKKAIKIVCVAVPVLIIVALVVIFLSLNSVVKTAVEAVLPKVLGVPVKLESVSISVFSGKGTLTGFIIGNPEGFKTDHAFALGKVRIDVDLGSLLSDRIIIEEIYIDGPRVTYEADLGGSNIAKIQQNIKDFAGPPKEDKEPDKTPEKKKGKAKKVQINRFVFKNGKIDLSAKVLQGEKLAVDLPYIELKDIGKEGDGKSVADVADEIFTPLNGQIVAVAKAGLADAKELLKKAADTAKDAAKGVVKGAVDDAGKAIKDAGKGVVDGVKDIFNRK